MQVTSYMRRIESLVVMSAMLAGAARAQGRPLTVDRIFGADFQAVTLPATHWLSDGHSFIDARDAGNGSEIVRTDAVTGKVTLLVPAESLVDASGAAIHVEEMTLSSDETKALLFHHSERVWRQNTKGQWTVVDLVSHRLTPISPATSAKMFAKFSPDDEHVAYVRDNDIFVWDLESGKEKRLTTDGAANIINGTTDWAYEEELGLRDAFRWSPDGRHIAFWRFDQSKVPMMTMENLTDSLYPKAEQYKYPKAGEPNSIVKIGVVSSTGGATRWMDTGEDASVYIPRMGWAGADSVWIARMPRRQNRLDLLLTSIHSGHSRTVLTETDSAYVSPTGPIWFNGGARFLLPSDRSGWRQFYLYDRSGRLLRQVTQDGADVLGIEAVDEGSGVVYARVAAPTPTQAQIFRFPLAGGAGARVTMRDGTSTMSLAPGGRYAAVTWSGLNAPPIMTLYSLPGMHPVRLLADNRHLYAEIDSANLASPEFIRIPAADGRTMLDAYRIVPAHFDPSKKYPVLMYTYGGPATPQALDAWVSNGRYLFHQMLAQHGYVVIVADNRGAAWRGREFRKQTELELGIRESDDQIAVAKWIGAQKWADARRIGIWGWSFGGFNTAMSAFRGGNVFRVAMSVAPVADWRFYDSIYTERFMSTPEANPQGYNKGSPLAYVNGLTAKYLLVHGTGDDNVHLQNSFVLAQRLQLARKPFEMMLFPNKTHSISGPDGTLPLFDLLERFVLDNL